MYRPAEHKRYALDEIEAAEKKLREHRAAMTLLERGIFNVSPWMSTDPSDAESAEHEYTADAAHAIEIMQRAERELERILRLWRHEIEKD